MALAATLIIPYQRKIAIFLRQRLTTCQFFNNRKQFFNIFPLLFGKFKIFLELRGKFYFIFHTSSAFRSASMLV